MENKIELLSDAVLNTALIHAHLRVLDCSGIDINNVEVHHYSYDENSTDRLVAFTFVSEIMGGYTFSSYGSVLNVFGLVDEDSADQVCDFITEVISDYCFRGAKYETSNNNHMISPLIPDAINLIYELTTEPHPIEPEASCEYKFFELVNTDYVRNVIYNIDKGLTEVHINARIAPAKYKQINLR